MGKFSDYFRRKSENGNGNNDGVPVSENYDYYEDAHVGNAGYTEQLKNFQRENSESRYSFSPRESFTGATQPREGFQPRENFTGTTDRGAQFAERPLQNSMTPEQSRNFSNFMVYEPKNADDVQTLIDFLKTRESAIINLDNVDPDVSQRVLDFVSGAIYALNGSVHRVAGNIFLLSPEGVGITNSYEMKGNAKKQ